MRAGGARFAGIGALMVVVVWVVGVVLRVAVVVAVVVAALDRSSLGGF